MPRLLPRCLAPVLRHVRERYPDVFVASIIDDTNFLCRDPTRASAAIRMFSEEMAKLGVDTVVRKTFVTASDNVDLSGGVAGATVAPTGVPFVGVPVGPERAADSFAASFISKRLANSIAQLHRLPLLNDPQLAVYLLTTTFAHRGRFLATLVPGAWGGRPAAGQAILDYARELRAAADACHSRPLPARAFASISEGGIGLRLIDSPAEHAFVFLSCHLRVLTTLRKHQPALATALLSATGPQSFPGRVAAARAALPLSLQSPSCTPACPALFNLDDHKAQAATAARRKALQAWRREATMSALSGAAKLAFLLATSAGALGGLFLGLYSSTREHLFSAADWSSAVLSYLGEVPPGLERLASDDDPLAGSTLATASKEKNGTHDGIRDALHSSALRAGLRSEKEAVGHFPPVGSEVPVDGDAHKGALRRIDNEVSDTSTGELWLADVTTPVALTAARIRDWSAGGPADKHVTEKVGSKTRKYADKPDGATLVPFVVGMFGETNKEALSLLGTLGRKAAEKANISDPLAAKHFAGAFTFTAKREISLALARGKVAQFELARRKLGRPHEGAAPQAQDSNSV